MGAHCSPVTEIFVVVDSDLPTRVGQIDSIRISVDAPSGTYVEREAKLADSPLPVTLGVQAGAETTSYVTVTATALGGGREIAKQTVRAQFADGEIRVLPIALCASCSGVQCAERERCDQGTCTSEEIAAAAMPAFGTVSRLVCGGPPADDVTNRPARSCETSGPGLSDCGPNGRESCCTSKRVPGGEFLRDNDGVTVFATDRPATVSDFRLDRYEVTVGRFRRFIAAVVDDGWRPTAGAGKHAHLRSGRGLVTTSSGEETGWDIAWTPQLPTTLDAWTEALECDRSTFDFTFRDTFGSDTKPITCPTWFEAFAFCIWDGGFLPSEAEWGYAASGGGGAGGQRVYPWSDPPTASKLTCELANYRSDDCLGEAAHDVGATSPGGDGAFGQADLGGNAWEWTFDTYAPTLAPSCIDCVHVGAAERVIRGGGFSDGAFWVASTSRFHSAATKRQPTVGFRCARAP